MTGPQTPPQPRRHHAGVVFTPAPLAQRLIAPLAETGAELFDPACGDGALLLAALEQLGGGQAAGGRLHGIEVRADFAEDARRRLVDAGAGSLDELRARLRCADALDPGVEWPAGAHVIANPPWLSFSGRHAGAPSQAAARGPGGWPSLQGAFFHRIAQHCGEHGVRARLLLPGSLLELERYGPIRAAALEHAHIDGPVEELGERAFTGVTEPAVIVTLAPGPRSSVSPTVAPAPAWVQRLEHLARLPGETFGDPGVHTGNASRELVHDAPGSNTAPLRRGADLRAYALGAPSLHLRLDLERTAARRFRIAPLEHYESFPILLRQTADRPVAALHASPTYFRNSLLGVRLVDGLAPEFVLAWLNCEAIARWHRAKFRDARQRSFPQVKVGHLRSLPIPIRARSEQPRLHDEVVARVQALGAAPDPGAVDALSALFDEAFRSAAESSPG